MSRRLNLLVVHHSRDVWPLHASIQAHLQSWRRHAKGRVRYLNVGFRYRRETLAAFAPDVVIFHTTALTLRWYPSGLNPLEDAAAAVADTPALKVAMPQDEYLLGAPLTAFFERARLDLLLTTLAPRAWSLVYPGLDRARCEVRRVLTGYLDARDVRRAVRASRPLARRRWWVRYRAKRARPWLGDRGRLKVTVGEAAEAAARARGKAVDVSLEPEAVVSGPAWFAFLGDARATVGVEGGASLHDPDGRIHAAVEAYLAARPRADYAEVRAAAVPAGAEGAPLHALSPRHLEAAATRTCQLLIEGDYNGVLAPWRHYIPLRPDLADLESALDVLEDDARVRAMTERAFEEVVASGAYSWARFVRTLETEWLARIDPANRGWRAGRAGAELAFADAAQRLIVPLELAYARAPRWIKAPARRLLAPLRPALRRPEAWTAPRT